MIRTDAARDRGAVLPITALVIVVLLISTSFAIDLGRQMMLRRDLQADADVIAFDLSRLLDGRTVGDFEADELDTTSDVRTVLARSAAANSVDPDLIRSGVTDNISWGMYSAGTDTFTALASSEIASAVRVTIADEIDYYFATVIGLSSGRARRSAVAADTLNACYSLGSLGVGLDSGQSALLNPLLADALGIGVLDYSGLVDLDILLGDLAAELGAGTVDELMSTTVSAQDFYLATAQVLRNNGNTAEAAILEAAAAQMGSTGNITVGDLFSTSTGDESALSTEFNVLDLISGVAFLANGDAFLTVPAITLGVGTLAQGTSTLQIIEGPQRACGGVGDPESEATTSQLQMSQALSGNVSLGIGALSVLNNTAVVTGTLTINGAAAGASIARIYCANPEGIDVGVLTQLLQVNLSLSVRLLNGAITVPVTVSTNPPVTGTIVQWRLGTGTPPLEYGDPVSSGSGPVGLSGATVSVGPASGSIPGLLNLVLAPLGGLNFLLGRVTSQIVNPLITQLDSLLVGPLTDLFGLRIAGADVAALSVTCTPPLLRQ